MEKWLIPGLRREMYKMSPRYPTVPENRKTSREISKELFTEASLKGLPLPKDGTL